MKYIKVEAVLSRLKEAARDKRVLYISGSAGMGKTAAVEYYFRRKPHLILSGRTGVLEVRPEIEALNEESALIFDDLSALTDMRSQEYILDVLQEERFQIVLIGRGRIPSWLAVEAVTRDFLIASQQDLYLSDGDVISLFADRAPELTVNSDDYSRLIELSYRNTLLLLFLKQTSMEVEDDYSDTILWEAKQRLFKCLDQIFFERLNQEMRTALLSLCPFSEFDVALAELLTGNNKVPALLDRMYDRGDFLQYNGNAYCISPLYREYLQYRQSIEFSERRIRELYERAALYYELQNDKPKALECFKRAENTDQMIDLLCRIALMEPDMADFHKVKKYFDLLPMATINTTPALMSAMSMIYALLLDIDESEKYCRKLEEYADSVKRGSMEQREALDRRMLLDAILPQADTERMLSGFRSLREHARGRMYILRPISLCGNTPSIINGLHDFSEYIHSNPEGGELIGSFGEVFTDLFGKKAVDVFRLSNAELSFEKDSFDGYDLSTVLNKFFTKADANCAWDVCFMTIVLMCRMYLAEGKSDLVERTFFSFHKKIQELKIEALQGPMNAFGVRLSMYTGEHTGATAWLETAPNSTEFFTILDRYIYVQKVRVLLLLRRREEAHSLIERLKVSFEEFHRDYYWIQIEVLKAILFYREGDERWREILDRGLQKAEYFGYYHAVSDEGAALKPLLDEFEPIHVGKEYLAHLKKLTDQMAINYPNYMKSVELLKEPLTATERKVIRLMCSEIGSQEICSMLNISYSGLKFHKQNIYRKFDVKNRQEAQRKAKSLGLNLA